MLGNARTGGIEDVKDNFLTINSNLKGRYRLRLNPSGQAGRKRNEQANNIKRLATAIEMWKSVAYLNFDAPACDSCGAKRKRRANLGSRNYRVAEVRRPGSYASRENKNEIKMSWESQINYETRCWAGQEGWTEIKTSANHNASQKLKYEDWRAASDERIRVFQSRVIIINEFV